MSLGCVVAASAFELLEEADHPGPAKPLPQRGQAFPANLVKRSVHPISWKEAPAVAAQVPVTSAVRWQDRRLEA